MEFEQQTDDVLSGRFVIHKSDNRKRLAFGWASIVALEDGRQVEDHHHDRIDIGELEQAAYQFVKLYREGGEMHERGGCATLVESMVFTKEKQRALGIPDGVLPEGWWIGFHVIDETLWEKVVDGTYSMFSIEGVAIREPMQERG